jgi:RNA polymerase sigma factor (sigma-70 family)
LNLKDEDCIAGLRSGDQRILEEVYATNYLVIERMILKNSGSTDEAKDVFQDAMIVFYKNISRSDFELTASITTYLYAICRRLWMTKLKEKSKLTFEVQDNPVEAFDFELVTKNPDETMLKVVDLLKQKGKNCLEILKRIYFNKESFDFIASELGYASGQVVREQKYRCIKRVREGFKELHLTP